MKLTWSFCLLRVFTVLSSDTDFHSDYSSDEDMSPSRPSSQQEALERTVDKTGCTVIFKDMGGDYLKIADWTGVECTEDGNVHTIHWEGLLHAHADGEICLDWLPPTLWAFDASKNRLKGTLAVDTLPRRLWRLNLSFNQLKGGLSLHQLPRELVFLHLENNRFEGSLDLTQLPRTLEKIALGHNTHTGSIDITLLPRKMGWVYLQHNRLSGNIHFYMLPDCLRVLMLNNNYFGGLLIIPSLPPFTEYISLACNRFESSIVLFGHLGSYDFLEGIDLRGNAVRGVISKNGCEIRSDRVWY